MKKTIIAILSFLMIIVISNSALAVLIDDFEIYGPPNPWPGTWQPLHNAVTNRYTTLVFC